MKYAGLIKEIKDILLPVCGEYAVSLYTPGVRLSMPAQAQAFFASPRMRLFCFVFYGFIPLFILIISFMVYLFPLQSFFHEKTVFFSFVHDMPCAYAHDSMSP